MKDLVSLNKHGAISATNTCVMSVAKEAPVIPHLGIKYTFIAMFMPAPKKVKYFTYLFLPSETNHIVLAVQIIAKEVDHVNIARAGEALTYASPYKIRIAIFPNREKVIPTAIPRTLIPSSRVIYLF